MDGDTALQEEYVAGDCSLCSGPINQPKNGTFMLRMGFDRPLVCDGCAEGQLKLEQRTCCFPLITPPMPLAA